MILVLHPQNCMIFIQNCIVLICYTYYRKNDFFKRINFLPIKYIVNYVYRSCNILFSCKSSKEEHQYFCISLKKVLAKKYYKKLQKYVLRYQRNFIAKFKKLKWEMLQKFNRFSFKNNKTNITISTGKEFLCILSSQEKNLVRPQFL